MNDLPIPKQLNPAPVSPAMGDAVTPPVVVEPAGPVSAPTPPTSGADRLRQSGDDPPVSAPSPLPPFNVPREVGAIARQVLNAPHTNREVNPHSSGAPSASSASQPGSAVIRDVKAPASGGKY